MSGSGMRYRLIVDDRIVVEDPTVEDLDEAVRFGTAELQTPFGETLRVWWGGGTGWEYEVRYHFREENGPARGLKAVVDLPAAQMLLTACLNGTEQDAFDGVEWDEYDPDKTSWFWKHTGSHEPVMHRTVSGVVTLVVLGLIVVAALVLFVFY